MMAISKCNQGILSYTHLFLECGPSPHDACLSERLQLVSPKAISLSSSPEAFCHTVQGQTPPFVTQTAPLSPLCFFYFFIFILLGPSAIQIAGGTVFHRLHLWLWLRPADKRKLMTHCDCESAKHKSNTWCETVSYPAVRDWNCFQSPTIHRGIEWKAFMLDRGGKSSQSQSCCFFFFFFLMPVGTHIKSQQTHEQFYYPSLSQMQRSCGMETLR